MRPLKAAYLEEWDSDFIRWTSNLLHRFLIEGSLSLVRQSHQPDIMIASIWRKQDLPREIPALLISNESWDLFRPHEPLCNYKAVLGIYPPNEPCTFIQYPYGAVHFDTTVDALYRLRQDLLRVRKTRFCCFVASNNQGNLADRRVALFQQINDWRRVNSGGSILNNMNAQAPRGFAFFHWMAQYKYMICLENTKQPGYITEKPFQSWFAGTVPIYDGGCVDQLNPDSLVNAASDGVLQQLMILEQSAELYEAKRRASLCDTPLSLHAFEKQFRTLVLETVK